MLRLVHGAGGAVVPLGGCSELVNRASADLRREPACDGGVSDVSPQAHHEIEAQVYGALATRPGSSIAGEHGIGLQKRADLSCSRTPEEIVLMHTLKTALEPRNILNPGKVLAGTG